MKTCPRTLSLLKDSTMKLGILGGGQLGRMLLQAAANYDAITYVLENDAHCPAAHRSFAPSSRAAAAGSGMTTVRGRVSQTRFLHHF
jgi:phosphoribosylaminoimidazole carboxylase (NCAIR synthetase)